MVVCYTRVVATSKELRAAWREKNRERIRAYDRERAKDPARAAKIAARAARWTKEHPDRARARRAKWREANRETINAKARLRKVSHRRKRLGHTNESVATLLTRQGGVCAICRTTKTSKWNLDHDHDTGHARGVLCSRCNLGIGLLQDSAAIARAAANYLDLHALL